MDLKLIDTSAETVLQEILSKYESLIPQTLGAADVERLLIDVMAYREVILRNLMQRIMEQNFVQTAKGSYLEKWGEIFGVLRNTDEQDDDYRKRILLGAGTPSVGTRSSYEKRIEALDEILDVKIESKQDDNTLPPGVVRLILIEKHEDNGIISGIVHTTNTPQKVLESINDKTFGLLGDQFIFQNAVPVAIDGDINLKLLTGTDEATTIEAVNIVVNRYIGELSRQFKGFFEVSELERRIRRVEGVREQSSLVFINVPNLTDRQLIQRGIINITRV